jgi:hypothetical protein
MRHPRKAAPARVTAVAVKVRNWARGKVKARDAIKAWVKVKVKVKARVRVKDKDKDKDKVRVKVRTSKRKALRPKT